MRISASAPTRIDLAGGTLDIWPLYLFHRDAQTINAAISLRAHAEVSDRADGRIRLESIDGRHAVEVADLDALSGLADLPLLARLASHFGVSGATIRTRGESPAGAGIAGSSALNVALCAALAEWTGAPLEGEALLTVAMNLEAQVIKVPTGLQDYRPALYGGVAAIELRPEGPTRVAIEVSLNDLQQRLVLAYTGAPHFSGTNNWEITKRHIDGDRHVFECFEAIASAARDVRHALASADWHGLAEAINAEWAARQRLAPGVTTPAIDALIADAFRAGARAAKVCGAGGGGCLFCLADPDALGEVTQALASRGAEVLDFRFESEGLRLTRS